MYYPFYIFVLQDHRPVIGSPCARTSPPINWSDRLVHGFRRRPVDRTDRQLRRLLLGARILRARGLSGHTSPHKHRQLRRTSLATPVTPRCLDVASYAGARTSPATPGTPRCSDIASSAGDSSILGPHQLHRGLLGARTSPTTLGTPRRSDIALGGRILLCLISVLSSCSMLFGSGC